MSGSTHSPYIKMAKSKRGSNNRPQSGTMDEYSLGFRSDIESETISVPFKAKARLHSLFMQIEREFDILYQENLRLQDKIDVLNEKLEKDAYDKPDYADFEINISKALTKKLSSSSQKSKTAHKLKAQTSKIVSSFKAPQFSCGLVKEYGGHKDGVWEVSVARPGVPVIGTASADHTACIWSIESTRCLLQYTGHSGSVNSIRFHPSKDLVLTGSGDCFAHVFQAALNWDLPKGHSSEEELEGEDNDDASDIIPPQNQRVSTLRTPIAELGGHSGPVSAAEWLAGAELAITASWDRTAVLHDVETGVQLTTLTGHDQELTHTASHPTQKLAVTSSRDTTFRLWDFREAVHSVSVFQGHTESVTSAVFTREDKVVSSSDDRSVKIWDLKNMRSPAATIRVDSPVNRLSVSSAGLIAIPHDNRHIRLFDLSGQRLARLPRARIWLTASGREDLRHLDANKLNTTYRLCSEHFEQKMFNNLNCNSLKPTAVPTIFPSLEGGSSIKSDHTYCLTKPILKSQDNSNSSGKGYTANLSNRPSPPSKNMRPNTIETILAAIFVSSILVLYSARSVSARRYKHLLSPDSPCVPCFGQECAEPPKQLCPWGEAKDYCGRRVCAKGPGERCEGPMLILGVCAEGLMCVDQVCNGCFLQTLDCYRPDDIILVIAGPVLDKAPCETCVTVEECDAPPLTKCPWGEYRDSCGRRICMKGPGDLCGGPNDIRGVCGEGLMCSTDSWSKVHTCKGCFITTVYCEW